MIAGVEKLSDRVSKGALLQVRKWVPPQVWVDKRDPEAPEVARLTVVASMAALGRDERWRTLELVLNNYFIHLEEQTKIAWDYFAAQLLAAQRPQTTLVLESPTRVSTGQR